MRRFLLLTVLIFTLSSNTYAQSSDSSFLSPKLKAFLIVSGYGAAGGALLGLASMAFDQSGRAIAQGASLGLYAGMLFGAYILYTHDDYEKQMEQYQNSRDYDNGNFSTLNRYDDFYSRAQLHASRSKQANDAWGVSLFNYSF